MPISGNAISSAIIISGSANFTGPQFRNLSKAVGKSVAKWIKIESNVKVIGSTTGAAGTGKVTGKMLFVPSSPVMVAAFAANTLVGPSSSKLAMAIANGIVTSLNATAGYRGSSKGAIGADVSKVVFANPSTLIPILKANMTSQRLVGMSTKLLASAISSGVATIVMTGTGVGVSIGTAGPAPSTGISNSKIF